MNKVGEILTFPVYVLDRDFAQKHITKIVELVDAIPLVSYTEKEVLAESKEGRVFNNKWEHSLIVFDEDKPISVIIAYERKAEENVQYPRNSLYISELAVDEDYRGQGIAKELVQIFLNANKRFISLKGDITYSVQTNSADWNSHVVKLYESFGFKKTTIKEYENRLDVILFLE